MTFQMTKGQTQFMKGIAILMMLMHHLIFSSDAIKIGSFDIPENIAHLFYNFGRICVPVFAFLSGWGLSLKKTIDGKYCLKKILLLLTIYEIVYIPLLLFSLGGGYRPSVSDVFFEIFALKRNIMVFCWYVPFYCISIFIIWAMYRLYDRSLFIAILSGIIMPILIFYMLGKSIRTNKILFDLSSHLMHYYPCVSVGYIVQRYNIFCSINRFFGEMNPRLLLLTGCILCGLFRYSITALDFIYGPVIVFCIGNYLNNCRVHPYIFGVTERFGEYSANIWFIHCAVFSQGIGVSVQKWVYFIKNPFFIYLVIMIAAFYIGNFLTIIDTYIFSMTCIRKKCLR